MISSSNSSPSVFSWFSPLYRVPNSALYGPEFQIYSATEATLRGNFMYSILTAPPGDTVVEYTGGSTGTCRCASGSVQWF